VVLEIARVMSAQEYEANLVFLCVAGEEQGLHGSTQFATWAATSGLAIDGMLTNDIVGGTLGGSGGATTRLCVFSGVWFAFTRAFPRAVDRYLPHDPTSFSLRSHQPRRDHLPLRARIPRVRLTNRTGTTPPASGRCVSCGVQRPRRFRLVRYVRRAIPFAGSPRHRAAHRATAPLCDTQVSWGSPSQNVAATGWSGAKRGADLGATGGRASHNFVLAGAADNCFMACARSTQGRRLGTLPRQPGAAR
jgi:hypothetical protein